eukprot:COSAG02_NODE_34829_length_477_cov_2.523810_2_plen_38_part_01
MCQRISATGIHGPGLFCCRGGGRLPEPSHEGVSVSTMP